MPKDVKRYFVLRRRRLMHLNRNQSYGRIKSFAIPTASKMQKEIKSIKKSDNHNSIVEKQKRESALKELEEFQLRTKKKLAKKMDLIEFEEFEEHGIDNDDYDLPSDEDEDEAGEEEAIAEQGHSSSEDEFDYVLGTAKQLRHTSKHKEEALPRKDSSEEAENLPTETEVELEENADELEEDEEEDVETEEEHEPETEFPIDPRLTRFIQKFPNGINISSLFASDQDEVGEAWELWKDENREDNDEGNPGVMDGSYYVLSAAKQDIILDQLDFDEKTMFDDIDPRIESLKIYKEYVPLTPIEQALQDRKDFDLHTPNYILSRDELEELLYCFQLMDPYRTGYLTRRYVLMYYYAMGIKLDRHKLRDEFKTFGRVKRWRFTFREVLNMFRSRGNTKPDMDELREAFHYMDSRKRKVLDEHDLMTVAEQLRHRRLEIEDAKDIIRLSDRDRDKLVNLSDFVRTMNRVNIFV